MTSWIEQIIVALGAVQLEAIFVRAGAAAITGSTTTSIDLLVRDTPVHRQRVHLFAQRLACARVPLSEQARTIRLVGGALPIDIIFGQLGAESYGAVRARAGRFDDALVASSPP
jgi:hypothetical protein